MSRGRSPGSPGAIEALPPAERDAVAARLRTAVPGGAAAMLAPERADALAAAGWEIGFHTRRHDLLTTPRRRRPPRGRRRAPAAARTLAYPHGKATAREAAAARDAGYVAAYTGAPEAFTDRTDPHLIGRLQPRFTTVGRFALDLARAVARP